MRTISSLKFLLFLFFISCYLIGNAQTIHIKAENKSLDVLISELSEQYQIQFSYNPEELSDCLITKNQIYSSPESALLDLLSNCQLGFIKNGNVFIIKAAVSEKPPPKKYYPFSGRIIDQNTKEALPFASIHYAHQNLLSDASGNFSFLLKDSIVETQIRYVGYYQTDSILINSSSLIIGLQASTIGLKEVIVTSNMPVFNMHIGRQAGEIKVNPVSASFLPGSQNNSVYNLLRLQAGIMAAGEQSNDYTIWGSYPGQTLIQFDHMTLFNISSFDNNLSVVNALIVKDIEVKKGGFNADYSNRVGGIINITGNDGDPLKFHGQLNLNNQAVSALINIPIAKKMALQTSFRQSFNQLLDWNEILQNNKEDDYFQPSYNFRDFNVKLSGETNNEDQFYVSMLASDDHYDFEEIKPNNSLFTQSSQQNKKQLGASVSYNKHWKKGSMTNAILSYSELRTDIENSISITNPQNTHTKSSSTFTTNDLNEFSAKIIHHIPAKNIHQLSISVDYNYNSVGFTQDTSKVNVRDKNENDHRIGGYIKDNISITDKFSLQPGLRLDFASSQSRLYFQPRINANYRLNEKWNITMAMGIYNQFLSKNTIIDKQDNYLFAWNLSNNKNIPVVSSQHIVLGGIYNNEFIKISIESFYKRMQNMSLFLYQTNNNNNNNNSNSRSVSHGESHSIGIDAYIKVIIKKHEFWVAYTLGQTLEHFSYFDNEDFQLAPQNQTHELKAAAVFNFHPIFVSANYVYGSGLEFTRDSKEIDETIPYHRLDLASMYKFNTKKLNLEIGFSILNVLNNYNISYNYFSNYPDSKAVYSKSIPFTPLLNLNIGF